MPIRSWTDDLPKCEETGLGHFQPQLVHGDCLDPSDIFTFYCHVEGDTFLYGIFEPHNGTNGARFALQRMAAELLFGQLNNKSSDEDIKEVLRNAFLSVEKDYIESIDGIVAERTSLQYQLPEGVFKTDELSKYRDILSRLKSIDQHLSAGATAVVALVHHGKLYVANVGESRALLCKTDENSVLRVVQLSVDHGFSNEDELLRLSHLGLDVNRLRNVNMLGNQCSTRCLGNYLVKGLYKAFPEMDSALSEPVIAVPEIHGPLLLDESCRFLILMSDGIYKRLEEATNTDQANKQLVQMTVEHLRTKSSLNEVSQSVVNQTAQVYEQYCLATQRSNRSSKSMTLLVRNFNYPLPNAAAPIQAIPTTVTVNNEAQSNGNSGKQKVKNKTQNNPSVRFNPLVQSHSSTMVNEESDIDISYKTTDNAAVNSSDANHEAMSQNSNFPDSSSATDTSSDAYPNGTRVVYDRNRRIKAYVDFTQYYENVNIALKNGTLATFMQPNQ